MNKIIKSVVSAVTALAVTLSVTVMFDVPEKILAAAEVTHLHKVCVGTAHDGCAHENIEFKPYPNDSDKAIVFRGDSYYLTEDIVLSGNSRFFVEKGVANLCLNGHSIKKDNGQIIDINNIDGQRAELNICDCAGTGKIENTSDVSGYACITVIDDSSFNLYGGCIDGGVQGGGIEVCNSASWIGSGGTANIYGGSVQTRDNYGVWLHDYGSSLSVYDGEIQASGYHTVYVTDEHCKASVYGGKISGSSDIYSAFCVRGEGASVDINGGEVIGQSNQGTIKCIQGTVEIKGGEVKSESQNGSCIVNFDTLIVSDGTVSCSGYYGIRNYVDYNDGQVSPGKTTISGGVINSDGSAIYNYEEATVEITGGVMTSGQYSAIYNYGNLKISDGKIDGKGTYTLDNYKDAILEISGGTVETENYALYNRTGGSASISGGNISGGGYCIWNNGTLDISDGEITSTSHSVVNHGTLNISGGSFGTENPEVAKYIANNKVLNLSGSPIFNNTSIWLQSNDNITISGALTSSEPYTVYVNSDLPRTITSGWDDRMTDKNASKYFKSPYNGAKIVYRDNEAVMVYYYKITYDANGGSCSVQSAETDSSDKLTSLAVPAREGYSFDGWFTEETGGEQVTTDTVFTDDTTIYAHWTTCNDHIWGDTYEKDENQHWKVCTKCGTESEKSNHTWNDGEETTPPTETTEGVKTYKCTVCNAEKTEKIDKLSHTHTYSDDWTSDENGHWHAATCGHDVKSGEAEHDFGEPTVTPSTCTQHGSEEYICRTCGYKKTVTLDLAEHSFDGEWQKDENNHWKVCTVCSTEKSEVTAHSWNDGEITKQPTENEAGVRLYTCTVCKATKTEPIAPLDHTHDWSSEWSKDDTYHWHDCLNNCGEKKDNAAHIWNDGTVTKQPAADAEGEKTFECTVCGKTKTETLPPKDEPSDPDSGNISVDVQPGENAPDTELKTPFDELADAVLTPEEQESIKNGIDIKIILIVSDATESVPADDRAKVEAAIRGLSGYKLGQYLDLNLLKIIGDSEGIRITQTNKPITVTFEIPAALRGKAEYSVIRVHGGETEVLRDLDSDSDTVTIETDKFSTYALVYKEKSTPSNPGGGNTSGENSGDSPNPPTSTPDESDNSDDTPSDDDNPSRDDSSDTTSSESEPTDEDNSDAASSDDGNAASSDDGNTTSSESDTSSNVSDHSPSESSPSEDNGNPSTGIAVSLIPLVTATAILTVAVKRKKK